MADILERVNLGGVASMKNLPCTTHGENANFFAEKSMISPDIAPYVGVPPFINKSRMMLVYGSFERILFIHFQTSHYIIV